MNINSTTTNSNHDATKNQGNYSHNFWNPAAATSFTPVGAIPTPNYFIDANGLPMPPLPMPPQGFYPPRGGNDSNSGGANSISPPPPFMIPSPPPPFWTQVYIV